MVCSTDADASTGDKLLIAFSCKGRGVCPSCATRRMQDTALHLVDRVIPRVPVRQWVLAFPWRVRLPLAYDTRLLQAALTIHGLDTAVTVSCTGRLAA